MKKVIAFISIIVFNVIFLNSCQPKKSGEKGEPGFMEVDEKSNPPSKEVPVITFAESRHDFGTLKTGDIVVHIFKFTNTGKVPLVIQDAKAQCGCTVPEWPHEPVQPGADGEIKVQFNSKGKLGIQRKAVTITANTNPQQTMVEISADVKE